ncbi:MAG TPA: cytochrome c oxidase assembly protein, partial [Alphaproteobacteria bacterium]|nr:cytochrome c oxidase assembly protein [Alphaproteobacteria bacterium]
AANTQVVFITVDPERDTPAILADYIRSMSDQAIGLSGSRAAIDEAIKGFGVYAVKVPLDGDDGDYTMDHTATVFLYDQTGALSGTIAWGERADFAREKLKRLISG